MKIRLHLPWDLALVTLGGGTPLGWVAFSSDLSDGYAWTRLKIIDPILKHLDLVISCPDYSFGPNLSTYAKTLGRTL